MATVKATDENLTSENWELIMHVVDKVSEADTGCVEAWIWNIYDELD